MNRKTTRFHVPASHEALKKVMKQHHPYDLAVIYLDQGETIRKRILAALDVDMLSRTFIELSSENQKDLLEYLDEGTKKALLNHLPTDELKEYLADQEETDITRLMSFLSPMKARILSLLLTFPDDTAASMMAVDFVVVNSAMTIKEATQTIITMSKENDYVDKVFVVDDNKILQGVISLVQLITTRPSASLVNIMTPVRCAVHATDSIEETIVKVVNYDETVVPIIDNDGRLIGIVTADDVFDELMEDTESDYQGIAQIRDHDNQLSAWMRSKRRLPWLMMAVFLNVMIALFLSVFEATVVEVAALVLFQPMILGMAGNIGTQALAVTILGLHHDEIDRPEVVRRHLFRETIVGLMNSLMMATLAFAYVYVFLSLSPMGSQPPFGIALVVFAAVAVAMFVAAMLGVLIPLVLNRFAIDPATASGPMMTTMNDLVALVIYFGIATLAFR